MTNTSNFSKKKTKRWHQKWWGIIFLLAVAIFLVYIGLYVYQTVILVEMQRQADNQRYASSSNLNSNPSALNPETLRKGLIETSDDPFWGPVDAKIVIVEFGDFQCPYCKQFFPTISKLRQDYGVVIKFIYRDIPNPSSHPDALNAALAANCALEQDKFWTYHDLLFLNQANLSGDNLRALAGQAGLNLDIFTQCYDSRKYLKEIQADMQDGATLGVTGTPTFFINGYKVAGVIPYDTFKMIIERMKDFTAAEPQANLNSAANLNTNFGLIPNLNTNQ